MAAVFVRRLRNSLPHNIEAQHWLPREDSFVDLHVVRHVELVHDQVVHVVPRELWLLLLAVHPGVMKGHEEEQGAGERSADLIS